jgi:hypothetical protein
MKEALSACPACSGKLEIRAYRCASCGTEVQGRFSGCPFCRMSDEDRYFCLVFLQCEGNMKDVEKVMGISYPTIKNRLARIREVLGVPVEAVPGKDAGEGADESARGGPSDSSKKSGFITICITDGDQKEVRVRIPRGLAGTISRFLPRGVSAKFRAGDTELDLAELLKNMEGCSGEILTVTTDDGRNVKISCE